MRLQCRYLIHCLHILRALGGIILLSLTEAQMSIGVKMYKYCKTQKSSKSESKAHLLQ